MRPRAVSPDPRIPVAPSIRAASTTTAPRATGRSRWIRRAGPANPPRRTADAGYHL